jgi:multicomponent Na+:H+ antiporter subunit C
VSVLMAATAAALFGIGTYLVLQRKLSRILIGLALIGHGGNVLMLTAGQRGTAPLVGQGASSRFSDPLPEALALTAIVITFATSALLLALAFRSWRLTADDDVEDDPTDRTVVDGGFVDPEVADERARMGRRS